MDTPGSPVHSQPRRWQLGCTWVLATSQQKIHEHFYLNPVSEASQKSKTLLSVLVWGNYNLLQSKFCREANYKGSQGCFSDEMKLFFSYPFSHICRIETQAILLQQYGYSTSLILLTHHLDLALSDFTDGLKNKWAPNPACAGLTSNPRQLHQHQPSWWRHQLRGQWGALKDVCCHPTWISLACKSSQPCSVQSRVGDASKPQACGLLF